MKKAFLVMLVILLVSGLVFSGCKGKKAVPEKPATPPAKKPAAPPAEKPATPPAEKPVAPPAEEPATPPAEKPVVE